CLNAAENAGLGYRVKGMVSGIFAGIGVKLQWQVDPHNCTRVKQGIVITFRERTRDVNSSALARAYPYDGVHVVIFLDAVREAALRDGVPVLLAHVMVHEMSHVLQGLDQHSSQGIMKAKWTSQDMVDMRRQSLTFASEDIERIRDGLRQRAASAGVQS